MPSSPYHAQAQDNRRRSSSTLDLLLRVMWTLLLLLFLRVVWLIIRAYPQYLPPDFSAGFLFQRERYFWGIYSTAFYLHIGIGPVVLLNAIFLMATAMRLSWRDRFCHWHRPLGNLQALLVIGLLAPTGIIMSLWAFTGPVAGLGFIFYCPC